MSEMLVTSFSREGAEQYGYRCVKSFQKHWPIPIMVYTDGSLDKPLGDPSLPGVLQPSKHQTPLRAKRPSVQ